jgi:hypothetical protein
LQRVATKLWMTAEQRVRIPALEREADVWRLASPHRADSTVGSPPMSSRARAGPNSTFDELGRAGEATAMTTPKVTEIRRPLHAVTPDSFIRSQQSPPRTSAPAR